MVKQIKVSEEFKIERDRLSRKYMIEKTHAACYLCNYNNLYFCNQFKNGCKQIEKCNYILKSEKRG